MKFDADAFVPLLSHPSHVRWTSSAAGVLESDELATISPLAPQAAALLFRQAELLRRTLGSKRRNPTSAMLRLGPVTPQDAIAWVLAELGKRRPKPSETVYVAWDNATAVRTRWSTFAEHWPTFCHAGGDDVVVLPESALIEAPSFTDGGSAWILFYSFEERFYLR